MQHVAQCHGRSLIASSFIFPSSSSLSGRLAPAALAFAPSVLPVPSGGGGGGFQPGGGGLHWVTGGLHWFTFTFRSCCATNSSHVFRTVAQGSAQACASHLSVKKSGWSGSLGLLLLPVWPPRVLCLPRPRPRMLERRTARSRRLKARDAACGSLGAISCERWGRIGSEVGCGWETKL